MKMAILSKAIYRLGAFSIKIPVALFTEMEKILKFIWKHKRSQVSKASLAKKDTAGRIASPDFKFTTES